MNPDYPHDWTSHHDITMKIREVSKHKGYTTNQQLILSMIMNINLDLIKINENEIKAK